LLKLRVPMQRAQHFLIAGDVRARHLDERGLAERIVAQPQQLALFGAAGEL
jgi:hypothetical protein